MQSSSFPRRIFVSSCASTSKPYFCLQVSNFCRMNRGRNGGSWSFNPNRESPNHPKQDNSSISANAKGSTSCAGAPQPRLNSPGIVESNISRNSQHALIVDNSDAQSWPDLASSCKKDTSRTKRAPHATTSSVPAIGHYGCVPVASSPGQPYNPVCATESASTVGPWKNGRDRVTEHNIPSTDEPLKIGEDGVMGYESPDRSEKIIPQPRRTLAKWEHVPFRASQAVVPSKTGWGGVTGHNIPERSENATLQPRSTSPKMEYSDFCDIQDVGTVGPVKIEEDGVMGQDSSDGSKSIMPQPRKISAKLENVPSCATQAVRTADPLKTESSGVMGHDSPERSNNSKYQPVKTSQMREYSYSSSDRDDYKPFDICSRHSATLLKASFLDKNREKKKDLERLLNDTRSSLLRPGMVLLKNFITHADQLEIVEKCRDFGLGDGGFYQPGYNDGAKLRLHMMCLGMDWDPQRRTYGEFRSIDRAKPPIIPAEFKKLVSNALQAACAKMQEEAIPWMEPDICIVNFYTQSGKLGLHQDRDESPESIKNGLPVVSFSIGDSAEFLYGDDRDVDKAAKVELKSGDVLIFGGKSRDVFHGVPSIIPKSAPKFLAEEARLRPGRLNLTFRKY